MRFELSSLPTAGACLAAAVQPRASSCDCAIDSARTVTNKLQTGTSGSKEYINLIVGSYLSLHCRNCTDHSNASSDPSAPRTLGTLNPRPQTYFKSPTPNLLEIPDLKPTLNPRPQTYFKSPTPNPTLNP